MKMFPLWLTFSACRARFGLKGIQIEQLRLLPISGGPGVDQTRTDIGQCLKFEHGPLRTLLDPHLARCLVQLSLTPKQATAAGEKKKAFNRKKP